MAHRLERVVFTAILAPVLALLSPAGHAQTSTLIYVCVHNVTGQVRFVAETAACTPPETRTSFNAVGPPGEKGDKGDKGDPGEKGDPGAGLETGSITGTATSCQGALAGAMVYLPGHSFVSVANPQGGFQLSYVPPGSYNLTIESAAGAKRTFPGVVVNEAQATSVGSLSIVDVSSDVANCGACGNTCPAGHVCTGGQCILNCPAGTANCAGTCVNLTSNPAHCGACGRACGANQFCSGGSCVCQSGFRDCDGNPANGCETNITASQNHCGQCFRSCSPTEACSGGTCYSTLRGPGSSCTSSSQCTTFNCVVVFGSGTCQGTVSCPTCYLSADYNTSCTQANRGYADSRCGYGKACTGNGTECKTRSGFSCSSGSQCISGYCDYIFLQGSFCR